MRTGVQQNETELTWESCPYWLLIQFGFGIAMEISPKLGVKRSDSGKNTLTWGGRKNFIHLYLAESRTTPAGILTQELTHHSLTVAGQRWICTTLSPLPGWADPPTNRLLYFNAE
jgi:hypothetical protein